MVYTYKGWILYKHQLILADEEREIIYFFTKRKPNCGIPCDVPSGYEILYNERIGLPQITKKLDMLQLIDTSIHLVDNN